jgi:flagellar motor switch protein FliM
MSALNPEQVEVGAKRPSSSGQRAAAKPRTIQTCNFRSAGRLSNENARALTAIQETFARHVTGALAAYVRTDVKVNVMTVEQFSVPELVETIPAFGYLAAFPLPTLSSTMILECGIDLVFPMIDLLLGGRGDSKGDARELSEIEEEIMGDVALLIARQAEGAWGMPGTSVGASRRVDAVALHGVFPASEKVVVAKFEVEFAEITGTFQLVFPTSLAGVLIKQSKSEQPQKKGALKYFPVSSLRERILDCDVTVAAGLQGMRVSVRDLIALQPGYVLKLRAPVRTPGVLTVEGRQIFEAVPVRNGAQKAAQVGRRVQPTSWGKE